MSANVLSWVAYFAFAACVLVVDGHERLFAFDGRLGAAKLLVWLVLAGFLAYSIHCSRRENLFRTVGRIAEFHWGRQIGIDLYLGLMLALLIIYLHQGTLVAALWALPTLAFANLAILLYFAVHFDAIVGRFLA